LTLEHSACILATIKDSLSQQNRKNKIAAVQLHLSYDITFIMMIIIDVIITGS